MKKIILMLILIPNIVFANVVYTEYEEYIMGTEEVINESDTIKREDYLLYNTYIEEIEERYAKLNELENSYQIDLNNYYTIERINLNKTEYAVNYHTKCFNKYENITDIKIIEFSSKLNLSEINYSAKDNTKVRLGIDNFIGEDKSILFDNNLYNESIEVSPQSFITFRLLKTTDLDNLILKLYFPKQGKKIINFKIILNYNKNLYGTFELNDEDTEINISFDKLFNEFLLENNFETQNDCISYYNEFIPIYKHFKINKIPLNNYKPLNNKDMFIIDDFIKKYNYYKREKLEIKDNIILENEKLNIKKYLTTTIPFDKLTIVDNIDYNKSGSYELKIYYQENLLLEHPIIYKAAKMIEEQKTTHNNIDNENKVEKTNERNIYKPQKKSTTKKITKRLTSNKKTTNKIIKTTLLKRLNNNIIIQTKDHKKTLIIIISSLILLLTIFEIILLYVKRKYF